MFKAILGLLVGHSGSRGHVASQKVGAGRWPCGRRSNVQSAPPAPTCPDFQPVQKALRLFILHIPLHHILSDLSNQPPLTFTPACLDALFHRSARRRRLRTPLACFRDRLQPSYHIPIGWRPMGERDVVHGHLGATIWASGSTTASDRNSAEHYSSRGLHLRGGSNDWQHPPWFPF